MVCCVVQSPDDGGSKDLLNDCKFLRHYNSKDSYLKSKHFQVSKQASKVPVLLSERITLSLFWIFIFHNQLHNWTGTQLRGT
jgi:hypothetical protein